jgi:hypothetical protein
VQTIDIQVDLTGERDLSCIDARQCDSSTKFNYTAYTINFCAS